MAGSRMQKNAPGRQPSPNRKELAREDGIRVLTYIVGEPYLRATRASLEAWAQAQGIKKERLAAALHRLFLLDKKIIPVEIGPDREPGFKFLDRTGSKGRGGAGDAATRKADDGATFTHQNDASAWNHPDENDPDNETGTASNLVYAAGPPQRGETEEKHDRSDQGAARRSLTQKQAPEPLCRSTYPGSARVIAFNALHDKLQDEGATREEIEHYQALIALAEARIFSRAGERHLFSDAEIAVVGVPLDRRFPVLLELKRARRLFDDLETEAARGEKIQLRTRRRYEFLNAPGGSRDRRDLAERYAVSLGNLPLKERAIHVLYVYANFSWRAIARVLGLPDHHEAERRYRDAFKKAERGIKPDELREWSYWKDPDAEAGIWRRPEPKEPAAEEPDGPLVKLSRPKLIEGLVADLERAPSRRCTVEEALDYITWNGGLEGAAAEKLIRDEAGRAWVVQNGYVVLPPLIFEVPSPKPPAPARHQGGAGGLGLSFPREGVFGTAPQDVPKKGTRPARQRPPAAGLDPDESA